MRVSVFRNLFAMAVAGSAIGARGINCSGPICEAVPATEQVEKVQDVPPALRENGGPLEAKDCADFCRSDPHRSSRVTEPVRCFASPPDPDARAGERYSITCQRPAETHCYSPPAGRSTEGLSFDGTVTGDEPATMAALEAASVLAFQRLARELRAHGAPRSLLRGAARAARDEVRHARAMRTLARRSRFPSPHLGETPVRSLRAIAIENAVEGCVGESVGALLAATRARSSSEPSTSAVLERIGRDEARHAELSFRVARWLEPRLSPEERRDVRAAETSALARHREALRGDAVAPYVEALSPST